MIIDARKPTDVPVPVNGKKKPTGVLIDTGTGQRIPFARKVDLEAGTYEAIQAAPDGVNYQADEDNHLVIIRGRAVGRLELVPFDKAASIGKYRKPEIVSSPILPMSKDQKLEGLETYKRCHFQVWHDLRHEARRSVDGRWGDYLARNSFLDYLVVKRATAATP